MTNHFGDELRALRLSHNRMTQQQLADQLGYRRAYIATIETGKDPPSDEVLQAASRVFPDAAERLTVAHQTDRRNRRKQAASSKRPPSAADPSQLLGGPYVLERFDLIYVFGASRSPEEIIELRSIRALHGGAHDFGLKVEQVDSTKFETDTDVLFGGQLTSDQRLTPKGETLYLRRIDFGRKLRRHQKHHFGLRYWVEHDPEPNDYLIVEMTNATTQVGLHLHFRDQRPKQIWQYGPLADERLAPGRQRDRTPLFFDRHGNTTASFSTPELGTHFGVGWKW